MKNMYKSVNSTSFALIRLYDEYISHFPLMGINDYYN